MASERGLEMVAVEAHGLPRPRRSTMPRYLVERTFPDGLSFPIDEDGRKAVIGIVAGNAAEQVTWVHSYVSDDDRTTWCIYDAPSPEAIRAAAGTNRLPVDAIHEVNVLDPYFYDAAS
jgi:hypothetical protein